MDLASYYDEYWTRKDDSVDHKRLDLVVKAVRPGDEVLQAGCGPGMLMLRLRDRGATVTGMDLSSVAVERAKQKGLVALQVDLDLDPLPFGSASFDVVVSDSAIEHMFFHEKSVREYSRVLRPGGRLVLLIPNIAHWRCRWWLLTGRFPYIADSPTDPSHIRFLTLTEAKSMLENLGLEVREVDGSASLWVRQFYPRPLRLPLVRQAYDAAAHRYPSLLARDLVLVGRKK